MSGPTSSDVTNSVLSLAPPASCSAWPATEIKSMLNDGKLSQQTLSDDRDGGDEARGFVAGNSIEVHEI